MRTFRLARVAAEAELLRLRRMARRLAIDAILLLIATLFIVAAFTLGHVATFLWLQPTQGDLRSVLYLLAGDLAVAVMFGLVVAFNGPGRIEREALEVRQTARLQVVESLTFTALLAGLTRALATRRYAEVLAASFRIFAKRPK